jgi:hypothetical protein
LISSCTKIGQQKKPERCRFVTLYFLPAAIPSLEPDSVHSLAAKTGNIGDGKIFVLAIESAVRIRTGETDVAAL